MDIFILKYKYNVVTTYTIFMWILSLIKWIKKIGFSGSIIDI